MNIETVWSEYQSGLKGFLFKHLSSPDDVDDVLQEVLIKTFTHLKTVKDTKKIKPWLFQVANRSITDFYRKRGKGADLKAEELWYEQEDNEIFSELSQCLLPFINALSNEQRDLLTEVEINGVSQKEYAQKNNIKYSTLKSQVQKSRQNLYALYSDCCDLSLDHQGNLIDFQKKAKNCNDC